MEAKVQQGIYTRAHTLIGLDKIVFELGGDFKSLLEKVGLPSDVLAKPDALISNQRVCELVERAAAELDCPDLGIRWSMSMDPTYLNSGPVMAVAKFVDSPRGWYGESIRYLAYHTNAYTFEMIERPEIGTSLFRYVVLSYDWSPRNCTEAVIANVVGICRVVGERPDENPIEVRFVHGAPPDLTLYEQHFGCPVKFDQPHTEIEFPNHMLDYRSSGKSQLFSRIIKKFVQYRIDRIEYYDASAVTNVKLIIRSLMGTGRVDQTAVCDVLEIHPRKLNRILAEQGTGYTALLESVRHQIAAEMLEETDVPVSQIAGLLDYSATAPFTTAFTRWKGISPLQWRKWSRDRR